MATQHIKILLSKFSLSQKDLAHIVVVGLTETAIRYIEICFRRPSGTIIKLMKILSSTPQIQSLRFIKKLISLSNTRFNHELKL
jgi:DNA-binding transcriptional regulator YiaG